MALPFLGTLLFILVSDQVDGPPIPRNFGSMECRTKVLAHNPEAENSKSVLNSNKDDYMRNPCKVNKKWFVIELCEPIQVQSLDIASLELFSSRPKSFKVFLSNRFWKKDWKFVGEFETLDERIIQTFQISKDNDFFAKFVKVELLDHYGSEHFCTITQFRVYGNPDFEEEPHDEDDNGDDDPDESDGTADGEQDSTNLFTSAKDTVINIVKKVLMVGPDDTDIPNVTDKNATVGMEVPDLSSPDNDVEMLPCLPRATPSDDMRNEEQRFRSANDRAIQEMKQRMEQELEEEKLELMEDKDSRLKKLKNQIRREIEEEESRLRQEKEGSIKQNICHLEDIPNGEPKDNRSEYSVGEEASISCHLYYMIDGPQKVKCLQDGTMTESPTCVPIHYCSKFAELMNGNVNQPKWPKPGETANFDCNTGHRLNGVSTTTCQPDGDWDLERTPTCL